MANLSQSACLRCREQKLRCSREQPICERCTRLNATCTYPSPPDRKLLAAKRARTRKRKHDGDHADSVSEAGQDESPSTSAPVSAPAPAVRPFAQVFDSTSVAPDYAPLSIDGTSLPQSVEKLLQDIYFTYVFNAALVVHRPRFEQAWARGQVPQHVLLAMYAFATNFLDPPCDMAKSHEHETRKLGNVRALGRQWAQSAGEQVLRFIDQPTLEKNQTCQILTLYWFSVGESRRNTMFSGIAYRATREILLDDDEPDGREALNWGVEAEMKRRCFWASYMAYCVNSDHYIVGSSVDATVLSIPLPVSERSFLYMVQEPPVTLSDILDSEDAGAHPRPRGEPNVWGETMRMLLQWSKIRDHIEASKRLSTKESVIDLLSMENTLLQFRKNLTPSLVYSKENMNAQAAEKRSLTFALLHIVYHQCRLILHASLVPQFSGLTLPDQIPNTIVQASARIAMDSAQAISKLASDMLSLNEDLARLAPFTGYCMYVAATVHIAFVSSRNDILRAEAWKNLVPTLKILKALLPYWKNLDRLWTRIHILYEAQVLKASSPLAEKDALSPDSVEQIAEMRRDSGRLGEPLANSVLQYSLRRLRNKVSVDSASATARQLEEAADSRRVANIMGGSDLSQVTLLTPTDSTGPEMQPLGLVDSQLPTEVAQGDNAVPFSMSDLFSNDDWWSYSLDPFQPAILPYADLFGDGMTM